MGGKKTTESFPQKRNNLYTHLFKSHQFWKLQYFRTSAGCTEPTTMITGLSAGSVLSPWWIGSVLAKTIYRPVHVKKILVRLIIYVFLLAMTEFSSKPFSFPSVPPRDIRGWNRSNNRESPKHKHLAFRFSPCRPTYETSLKNLR